ncbi:CynX/NimT family MFS transporter [Phaeacidiphilus oryzae]|uniref:CynX/NimT family MFS transporter n=1 Tax=Phaeacidiphilus oryzae TaxID=348818 RepID=UPI0009FE6525|nr:MFS transporter [Phaeacidiphilus oryzae]
MAETDHHADHHPEHHVDHHPEQSVAERGSEPRPHSVPASGTVRGSVRGPAGGAGRRARTWLPALAMIAAAFNLRPAVTSLGPLLDQVRHSLGMSGAVAGLLTSVPSVCFALFGVLAPMVARRVGPAATVLLGMVAVAAGLATRSLAPNTPVFLLLSAVALAGIAVSNVLMPVLVKRFFPDRIGPMTGVYSMALSAGTAAAAAATVPLTGALGGNWQPGLALWAIPAAVAVLAWIPRVRDGARPRARTPRRPDPASGAASTTTRTGEIRAGRTRIGVTRSRTAWFLAVFFGLQATAAYVTMGWLPQIYQDAGVSAAYSGLLLAITMAVSAPLSFVLPALAARRPDQGPFVVLLAAAGLVAYAGLWLAPASVPVLWALLAGLANSAFPLALTMIGLRARGQAGVAELSAFAQSVGYLISIPGPMLVGVFYQHTGGWTVPLAFMAVLLLPQAVAGWLAGRPRYVEDEATVAD